MGLADSAALAGRPADVRMEHLDRNKKGPRFAARAESTKWVVEETDFSVTNLLRRTNISAGKEFFNSGNEVFGSGVAALTGRTVGRS